MFLTQFLNHAVQERIGRQLVHLVGAVKEDVQEVAAAQLAHRRIIQPARHNSRLRHRLIFQRYIAPQVLVIPFPAFTIAVELVPFFHRNGEVLRRPGGILQPAQRLGPQLPFQPLLAGGGGFFLRVLQFGVVVNGPFVLLQFAFQLYGAFLFQFLRQHIVCQRIVPTGEAIRRIQQAVIVQYPRHDLASSKNNFVFLRKWFRFTPAFSPISRGSNPNSNQMGYKTADRQGKEEPRHADAPQVAVRIDSYTKRNYSHYTTAAPRAQEREVQWQKRRASF